MTDRKYKIKWKSGDEDAHLTQGEVLRIAAELSCEWVDVYIVENGVRVGSVIREDDY